MRSTSEWATRGVVLGAALAVALVHSAPIRAEEFKAYRFVLDYNVPETPAATIIGAGSANVLRAGAAKPLGLELLSAVQQGTKMRPGAALDVSPYMMLGGRFASASSYQKLSFKRVLANTSISAATIEDPTAETHLLGALGIRITVFDDHDPLQNANLDLTDLLGAVLETNADAIDSDVEEGVADVGDQLSKAYANARAAVSRTDGWALSAAWAGRAAFASGVISADSASQTRHSAWLMGARYFREGSSLLATGQFAETEAGKPKWRAGLGFRNEGPSLSVAAEAYWESRGETSDDARVGIGGSADYRVVRGVHALASFSSGDPTSQVAGGGLVQLRLGIKWALSELTAAE